MKYLKLLRWNNLLMIFFVQMLTQFALVNSLFYQSDSSVTFPVWLFGVISMGTLLIAGGGYVINDIYDVAIDAVNKPRRRMIENYITKTQAWRLYALVTSLGLLLGGVAACELRTSAMAVIFIINALVLWIYSAYLKKLPFIGNLTISVLTASSVVVIWFANKWFINFSLPSSSFFVNTDLSDTIVMVYVFFALWSNLIREIIKDIEDFEGDQKYGGNTIPIAFGRTIAVRLTTGLSVFMIVMLFQPLVWMWQEARLIFLFHTIGLVIFPLVLLIRELLTASQKSDFHRASSLIKLIMMLGVLSMIWFLL